MSENETPSGTAVAGTADAGFTPPDKSLTLRPERLAGSPQCLNCGTSLKGPFCYYCGQPDRHFLRFFPVLLREFMEDFLELDSRFVRTVKPLLFKPGRLTRNYLEGRRYRYTPPMRLYLFSSIAFFLLATMVSVNAINIGTRVGLDQGETQLEISQSEPLAELTPDQRAQVEQALTDAGIEDSRGFLQGFQAGWHESAAEDAEDEPFAADQIMIDGKPWNRETNPFEIGWMPDFINEWINDEIEESPDKARRIEENPNLMVEQVFDILPGTMFVLLPVVALLFKFWYLFARRYYIEHLIFALHNHSFVFVSLILLIFLNIAGGWFSDRSMALGSGLTGWLILAVSVWIPLYLLISLRHVYRQNWFLTVLKFGVIGVSYLALLALVSSVVAALGFVLL